MFKQTILLLVILISVSCGRQRQENDLIDEDKLGIIDADVNSDETNFKQKATYSEDIPGKAEKFARSFENAPPLIPHTTVGFFPIQFKKNICLSCHMPEKVAETGAVKIPETHFSSLRPQLEMKDGVYSFSDDESMVLTHSDSLNNSFFNCNQCHVPQANVRVNIENLFTPEFREELGLEKSNLNEKIEEGIN